MCSPGEAGWREAGEQVVAALGELVGELAGAGEEGVPVTRLMTEIKDLCGFADRVYAHLARLAGALDAPGRAVAGGYSSAAAFLRAVCGRAPGHASELAGLGRELARRPATARALAAGGISADAAVIITRTAAQLTGSATAAAATGPDPAEAGLAAEAGPAAAAPGGDGAAAAAEEVLLAAAAGGVTAAQLRALGEEVAYRADPVGAEEREKKRWEKRYLSFGLTFGGTGVLSGACGDSVSFEVVRTAAEAFAAPDGAADTRTAAQRRLDGLVAACRAALDTGAAPRRHRAAPHVSVLVRDETLAQLPGAPPGRTSHASMLTARQVLALCCGAQLTALRWRDGLPLDVGRAARTEPPQLRTALEARDLTCRWPGCDIPAIWCTGHHIGGWHNGAPTRLTAMVLLCWVHHMHFIHLLGWSITGNPNATIRFHHPAGIITLHSPLPGNPRAP